MPQRPIADYSRQELYDLVWSAPAPKPANALGVTHKALLKRCRALTVPRPSRRYWAKLDAGQTPKKRPLPLMPNVLFKEAAQRHIRKSLPLPMDTEPLFPLATELEKAINKGYLDDYQRARVNEPPFPEALVSKSLAERVARAFHVLVKELEPCEIRFRKSLGSYDSGYFERRRERLYLVITEDILQPDGSRVRSPSWQSQQRYSRASGLLTFSTKPNRYGSDDLKEWSESKALPLERLLSQLVVAIRQHYLDAQERDEREAIEREHQRIESERRHREWEQQETIRLQKEKEGQHAETLAAAATARQATLTKAAHYWSTTCALHQFIDECERRWKEQTQLLTPTQTTWLTWARNIADSCSPFSAGYPDPINDGPFDPSLVPMGGPYPPTRRFNPSKAPAEPSPFPALNPPPHPNTAPPAYAQQENPPPGSQTG